MIWKQFCVILLTLTPTFVWGAVEGTLNPDTLENRNKLQLPEATSDYAQQTEDEINGLNSQISDSIKPLSRPDQFTRMPVDAEPETTQDAGNPEQLPPIEAPSDNTQGVEYTGQGNTVPVSENAKPLIYPNMFNQTPDAAKLESSLDASNLGESPLLDAISESVQQTKSTEQGQVLPNPGTLSTQSHLDGTEQTPNAPELESTQTEGKFGELPFLKVPLDDEREAKNTEQKEISTAFESLKTEQLEQMPNAVEGDLEQDMNNSNNTDWNPESSVNSETGDIQTANTEITDSVTSPAIDEEEMKALGLDDLFTASSNFTSGPPIEEATTDANSTLQGRSELLNDSLSVNATFDEINGTLAEITTTAKPSRPPPHPCLIDLDESEPEFQRFSCAGNRIAAMITTTALLAMILFSVTKNIASHGCLALMDVRKPGVSFPKRPEIFVLLCSTLPLIFTTLARPLFWPYNPRYFQFINEVGFMQSRLFFDLFTRTASVYHLVYWAYRMPIIRFLWCTYLRIKAFRQVWTKEHIIEVLQDKFAPSKETKMRRGFQNTPEYMMFYAQFLQSGLPMQYLQYLNKSGARSPTGASNAGYDGFQYSSTQLGSSSKHSRQPSSPSNDVVQRANLGNLTSHGGEHSSSPGGGINHSLKSLYPSSAQVSRGPSFKGSQQGRVSPNIPGLGNQMSAGGFGQHLSPDDALMSKDPRGSNTPVDSAPNPEFLAMILPALEAMEAMERKKKEEEAAAAKAPPPSREFLYICKHAIPGAIYIISLIVTFPSIFGFDTYQYESTMTRVYFFYDMIFVVSLPLVAIIIAFYHGALAKKQLNGGTKMHYRLRCYYVNFILLNIPMLVLMMTATSLRMTDPQQMETERYATVVIIALTVYHANFVLKATVYTTGCNCICCSTSCLMRVPRLNKCLITMTTPRIKGDQQTGPYETGAVIQIDQTAEESV